MRQLNRSTQEMDFAASIGSEDARDLQARLYREIGISAVAAALFASNEMDRPPAPPLEFSREKLENWPAILRADFAA